MELCWLLHHVGGYAHAAVPGNRVRRRYGRLVILLQPDSHSSVGRPFLGGPPYGNLGNYDRASPIRYIQNAKTPTMLENGEMDSGAPGEQVKAFWHALVYYKVPTKLVIYPGESHGFHDPVNIRQRAQDTVAWFDQWLTK